MDRRQTEIKEGAGLEESRLNTDFIDFLQSKWVTYFLVIIALIAGLYYLNQRRAEARLAYEATAFADYEAVRSTDAPSPTNMIAIAEDYSDVPGVAVLARLRAGDLLMQEALGGTVLGAQLDVEGEVVNEDDRLSDEDIENRLDSAAEQYRLVLGRVESNADMAIHSIGALFGLATVAETRGNLEEAAGYYDRLIAAAERAGYPQHASIGEKRKADVEAGLTPPKLWDEDDLPEGRMIAATRNYGLAYFREGDDTDTIKDNAYTGDFDATQPPELPPVDDGVQGPVAPNAPEPAGDSGSAEPDSGSLGGDGATDEAAGSEAGGDNGGQDPSDGQR